MDVQISELLKLAEHLIGLKRKDKALSFLSFFEDPAAYQLKNSMTLNDYHELAWLFLRLEEKDKALSCVKSSGAVPTDVYSWINHAHILCECGDLANAELSLEKACALLPFVDLDDLGGDVGLFEKAAMLWMGLGKAENVLETYQPLLAHHISNLEKLDYMIDEMKNVLIKTNNQKGKIL